MVSVARQVFVMGCVAENLHARRRHEHLLLQLQSLVIARHTDVRLDAHDLREERLSVAGKPA